MWLKHAMLYETMWLKEARVLSAKRFATQPEAEREAYQLLPYYKRHFGAERAEVWSGSHRLFLVESNESAVPPA